MRIALICSAISLLPVALAGSGINNIDGIVAANSVGGTSSYTCRSQDQWNRVAYEAKDADFRSLRILGFDCDALERASSAAARHGLQVLAGIWITGSVSQSMTQINNDVQTFRRAVERYGAGRYSGLTIGNEVPDQPIKIMEKVWDVRGYLNNVVGIHTPVSTVDTWVRIRDNPVLCNSDFVGANAHVFYDGNRWASQAGEFMEQVVVPSLRRACPGKKIVITETGWPKLGQNNRAFGSRTEAEVALTAINCYAKKDRSIQYFAFEYDDQQWKGNDAERSFGIFGTVYFRGC